VDRIPASQLPFFDAVPRGERVFETRGALLPPPAASRFAVRDQGNASPRFVRMTLNAVPSVPLIVQRTRICIGGILQPLAQTQPGDSQVLLADTPAEGPFRCPTCRCYVNPFFKFVDLGKAFVCNMCESKHPVPEALQCNLGSDGVRRDKYARAEFCRGSVEFTAPASMWGPVRAGPVTAAAAAAASAATLARPEALNLCYVFALDVSAPSVYSGYLNSTVDALRAAAAAMAARAQTLQAERAAQRAAADAVSAVASVAAAGKAVTAAPVATGPYIAILTYNGSSVQVHTLTTATPSKPPAPNAGAETYPEPEVAAITDVSSPFLPVPASMCFAPLSDPAGAAQVDAALASVPALARRDADAARAGTTAAAGAAAATALALIEELAGPGAADRKKGDSSGQIGTSPFRVGGGRVLLFSATLPTVGAGALTVRENGAVYSAPDKPEHASALSALYAPTTDYYETLAVRAVGMAVAFDLFSCALSGPGSSYADVVTMSALTTITGGQLYRYTPASLAIAPASAGAAAAGGVVPGAFAALDGATLARDVKRNLAGRDAGCNGVLIVRASAGLSVKQYLGAFYSHYETVLATVDADKAVGFQLEHAAALSTAPRGVWADGGNPGYQPMLTPTAVPGAPTGAPGAGRSLPPLNECCVQAALLYTTCDGERRIRVHTLSLPVAPTLLDTISYADVDAITALTLKQAAQALYYRTAHAARAASAGSSKSMLADAQDAAVNAVLDALYWYRRMASSANAGQLVLPDTIKLLPLWTLGLIKSDLLCEEGTGVRVDDRIALAVRALSAPAALASVFVVPRMHSVRAAAAANERATARAVHEAAQHAEELAADAAAAAARAQAEPYPDQRAAAQKHAEEAARAAADASAAPVPANVVAELKPLQQMAAAATADDIVILDDSSTVYIVVGAAVPAPIVEALFRRLDGPAGAARAPLLALRPEPDFGAFAQHPSEQQSDLCAEAAHLHGALAAALGELQRDRPWQPVARVVLAAPAGSEPNAPPAALRTQEEVVFFKRLVQDRARGAVRASKPTVMSYVDFLCWLHQKIQLKISQ
jgi:protein transport protein SEC24